MSTYQIAPVARSRCSSARDFGSRARNGAYTQAPASTYAADYNTRAYNYDQDYVNDYNNYADDYNNGTSVAASAYDQGYGYDQQRVNYDSTAAYDDYNGNQSAYNNQYDQYDQYAAAAPTQTQTRRRSTNSRNYASTRRQQQPAASTQWNAQQQYNTTYTPNGRRNFNAATGRRTLAAYDSDGKRTFDLLDPTTNTPIAQYRNKSASGAAKRATTDGYNNIRLYDASMGRVYNYIGEMGDVPSTNAWALNNGITSAPKVQSLGYENVNGNNV